MDDMSSSGLDSKSILQNLPQVLGRGEIIWYLYGKATLKLPETVVVKVGTRLRFNWVAIMDYVR